MPLDYGEIRLASCAEGRACERTGPVPGPRLRGKPVVAVTDVGVGVVVDVERELALRLDLEVHVAALVVHADEQPVGFGVPRKCDVDTVVRAVRQLAEARVDVRRSVVRVYVMFLSSVRVVLSHTRASRRPSRLSTPWSLCAHGPPASHRNEHAVLLCDIRCDVGGAASWSSRVSGATCAVATSRPA